MDAGQIELAKSYIAWMRGRNTLSLDGYYPGWENAARDSIGVAILAAHDRKHRSNNPLHNFQKPHFLLETGGGTGYTHFRLARKGEMTDPRTGSSLAVDMLFHGKRENAPCQISYDFVTILPCHTMTRYRCWLLIAMVTSHLR